MKKISLIFILFVVSVTTLFADEGMWIPILLGKNIDEMRQMGCQLSAKDIYDANHSSLKDAVILFGGGCTGELISGQGLLITNHHCGYGSIQRHSSVESDYLTNGFWAMSKEEELPNPGLTVKFLQRMEDVTGNVMDGTSGLEEEKKQGKIDENIKAIEQSASDSGHFYTVVKPLYYGNQYFLYVYLEYKDVRLVGAPPSAIGKFGGDTDNWMWPRHTGDFSLFRIYADKNNQPAEYSKDNVPYHPEKFLQISMEGVHANDFTMVLGNPGHTNEYLPSPAVSLLMKQDNPEKIRIRDTRLAILSAQMNADRKVRIQYSAKYAGISNSWKRWQGEILGLKRLDAIQKKKDFETDFTKWVDETAERKAEYGKVLPDFDDLYSQIAPYSKARDYYNEIVVNGCDVFRLASILDRSAKAVEVADGDKKEILAKSLENQMKGYFKDYDQATDEKVFLAVLRIYRNDLDAQFLPPEFISMMDKMDDQKLKQKIYESSALVNRTKLLAMAENLPAKGLKSLNNDPLMRLYRMLVNFYNSNVSEKYAGLDIRIQETQEHYMKGIMEMKAGENIYPDANYTLRVSYGKVEGYIPRDGVKYDYYSTIDGIMEKDNPEIYDYNVPQKLRDLYEKKDFGGYATDGKLSVCFIASNHTTGGNSGSPVINARGELIGVNFDRCWEGTMSDVMFDPDHCRNIVLDIRYALFIIDKFAGAGYLLNEMDLRY